MTARAMPVSPNDILLGEHSGIQIALTPTFQFRPLSDLFEEHVTFASMNEARAAIDQKLKVVAKAGVAAISMDVLDEHGQIATIKGVHAAHGHVLGVDKGARHFYPRAAWILNGIVEQGRLRAQLTAIEDKLKKVRLSCSRSYGRIDGVQHFSNVVERLRSEFEEKRKLADEIAREGK